MLERKQLQKAEFRVYADQTSEFVPWFQKSMSDQQKMEALAKHTRDIESGVEYKNNSKIEDLILKI